MLSNKGHHFVSHQKLSNALKSLKSKKRLQESTNRASERIYNSLLRMRAIHKLKMVVIFNLPNSHLLTLSLPTEEVFQVNGQNRPVANLPVVDFHS